MRRLTIVLLASLQLCNARSNGFSIHEDLLAFPQVCGRLRSDLAPAIGHMANWDQYEVVFSDIFISEKDAHALLERNPSHPTYSADFSQPTITEASASNERTTSDAETSAKDGDTTDDNEVTETYQLINMAPHKYLCTIPVIQPPGPENQTANELAKAAEARELSRAAVSGWDLLADLEDMCLYHVSGWWSYSFCNNQEIVQYHAIAAAEPGRPPQRDPTAAVYVLGSVPAWPEGAKQREQPETGTSVDSDASLVPAELQVRGDKRYLVQKLEGGTECDLTGRDRTIEVQYHCVPGMKGDRIASIREVTICSYVMVVNTGRLCDDVAFLPPVEIRANPISCQLIAENGAGTPLLLDQELRRQEPVESQVEQTTTELDGESLPQAQPEKQTPVTIGGVVVGARNILSRGDETGKASAKLEVPRSSWDSGLAASPEDKTTLAEGASKEDGGKVKGLSTEELEQMKLEPELIKQMQEKIQELAGDLGWKLEIVDLPGGEFRELHGYIDEEEIQTEDHGKEAGADGVETKGDKQKLATNKGKKDGTGKGKGTGKGAGEKAAAAKDTKKTQIKDSKAKGTEAKDNKAKEAAAKDTDATENEGSEEKFFKEEL